MNNKLIASLLIISLCFSSTPIAAQYPQTKDSAARRIAFFLLHGACTVSGSFFTLTGAGIALFSAKVKKADPLELEKIKNELINKQSKKHGWSVEIDQQSKDAIEFLKKPAVVPVASTCAIASAGITIYGLQGLFKDLMSLFNN